MSSRHSYRCASELGRIGYGESVCMVDCKKEMRKIERYDDSHILPLAVFPLIR